MKFLQKEKDPSELAPHEDIPKKKKHKKDHMHSKEGEISAFFTAVRPALAEKDINAPRKNALGNTDARRGERGPSTKSSSVVPTVEVNEHGPFLGFGSRGPRHESTSYVSWSESIRGPDLTPQHRTQVPTIDQENRNQSQDSVADRSIDRDRAVFKRPAPPSVSRHRAHDSTDCFNLSSFEASESCQRVSRSHSYPQHVSSPQKVNLVDRAAKLQSTDNMVSPSSMPPSMPARVSDEPNLRYLSTSPRPSEPKRSDFYHVENTSMRRDNPHHDRTKGIGVEPSTSSDLGKVIEQCNHTFSETRRATAPPRRHTTLPEAHSGVDGTHNYADLEVGHRRQQGRTVRFSGLDMPSPVAPNFPGPSIYERPADCPADLLQALYDEQVLLDDFYPDDEEEGDAMGAQETWRSGLGREEFEFEPLYGEEPIADRRGLEESLASDDQVQPLASDNSVVARGFWRPNRLY